MSDCQHKPTADQKAQGYDACMFCVETGGCNGGKGKCKVHNAVAAVWADQAADAEQEGAW